MKNQGFTLIELLVTVAIVASLASLLLPEAKKLAARAEITACASNLRQVGLAGFLYAAENNQKLPTIEPWPSQPQFPPEDEVGDILTVLEPYGLTSRTLICRTDVRGPDYHATEGSSYEWCPMANGQSLQGTKLSWGNMPEGVSMSRLLVAFDYSNVHGGASNVLFGDGHVGGAVGN